jgi:hypothetical protein
VVAQEAISDYTVSLSIVPDHFKSLNNRAFCYERLVHIYFFVCLFYISRTFHGGAGWENLKRPYRIIPKHYRYSRII